MKRLVCLALVIISVAAGAQDTSDNQFNSNDLFSGFVRAGFYSWTDPVDDKLYVSSAFSDFGLKLKTADNSVFNAFTDLRFRYGSEFMKPVSRFDIREAYVGINGKKWDLFGWSENNQMGPLRLHESHVETESAEYDFPLARPGRYEHG